jgi:hypothetical protein
MSLKFLAVGQTFAGLRDEKSPFALRKENQLPIFEGTPRFSGKPATNERGPVQTDWLQPTEPVAKAAQAEPVRVVSNPFQSSEPAVAPAAKPKPRWFSFFRMKWFRTNKAKADLVQSELSLEKVRVKRNDLADSDLELVLKKRKKTKPVFVSSQENNNLPRAGWSELAARLFEIGQK